MVDLEDDALDPGDSPARRPITGAPAWWGPIANESEHQLTASEFDVFEFADLIGSIDVDEEQLRAFASASPSRHRYLICEHLSTTRWAWVYVALDLFTERPVVLKISAREVEPEGRTITRLSHPNVVTVHDMFVEAGYPTMVLEWCSQGNLGVYALAAQDWREVIGRGLEAGRGLAYCHEQGMIHGDIKPDNILVTWNVGRIADFGIARGETNDGQFGGTLGFMPPEREHGVWSTAGDVYSFATTLVWVLKIYRDVPEAVGLLLTAAADEVPERRPTLPTLIAELQRLLAANDELVTPQPTVERVRWGLETRRQRVFLQTAIVAMLAIVSLGSAGLTAKCMVAPAVELREPSIERAIELATADDPAGAWLEFHRLDQTNAKLYAEELNRLAEALLASTERFTGEATAETAASLAEIVAIRAHANAFKRGNDVERVKAQSHRDAARKITRHN